MPITTDFEPQVELEEVGWATVFDNSLGKEKMWYHKKNREDSRRGFDRIL
jgi:hypothetical protein